jgi:MobA/MobL family
MAVYFLRARHVSRGKGARVTRAAAYRAGERIRDERTGEIHDYTDRHDVAYKEVVLPADLAGRADMSWTQDRSTLWNAAEHAGARRNSRLAREWLVLLPPELNAGQRSGLVHSFANELANKYRCAVDISVHQPRPGADSRNHHAHLLMTTREVTPNGLGSRTALELGGWERRLAGLGSTRDDYLVIRERWAQLTNEALRQANLTARVDHRSLERQGIDRESVPTIPEKVFYAERSAGGSSVAGDAIRARHRERLEARLRRGGELTRVREKQNAELKERAIEHFKRRELQPQRIRWSALTRAERNEHRRVRYLARRALEKQDPVREAQRREAVRLRARARLQQNPEAVREERRRWRQAHAEEVNRKQREYRRARAELGLSKTSSPNAEQSVGNWQAYRNSHAPGPTAAESARDWRRSRDSQAVADSAPTATARVPEQGLENVPGPRGSPGLKPARGHEPDFGP